MGLRRVVHHRERSALLPSLGGIAVIAAVVAGNCWWMLSSPPDLAPLQPLERLTVLQQQATLPDTALAAAGGDGKASGRLDVPGRDGLGPGTLAQAAPVRLQAPLAGETPPPGPQPILTRSWVVQPGESLNAALGRLFVVGPVARDVVQAYASARDPQKLQAGWRLWARFASAGVMDSGALRSLVVAPAFGEGLTIERQTDGSFSAREGGLPGTLVRQALRCGVTGTLEETLRRCGEGEGLVALLQPLLGDRLRTPVELNVGDELRIVMDKLMDGDLVVRYHHVAAIEHRSIRTGKATVALWFDGEHGAHGYFTPDGDSAEPLLLRQPLRVGRATSGFGMRLHPILHRMKAHYGVDFGAPRGTPVFAAGHGSVLTAARVGAAGNLVRLRHDDGYLTEYMHLQKFAPGLGSGDKVTKGQVIGFVGSTGRSTGPHLHFGVRQHGKYLDPTTLADVPAAAVTSRDRKAFDAQAAELRKLLDALGKVAGAEAS